MPKNSLLDWDTVAANNTDIAGIGTQGTSAVSNFDDAFRTLMAQVKAGVDYKQVYANKTGNYTALTTDNNAFINVTATSVTITLTAAATLAVNWHCIVYANGFDVTIDPNGAELINGAATLTVKNGCFAMIYCTSTAFVAAVSPDVYQPLFTIASATTTDLSTVTSTEGTITGTTTITGLGTAAAGILRNVYFGGTLTLTHNGTSLILPTGANITTATGDRASFVSLGSGNWRCISYVPSANMTPRMTLATSVASTSGTNIDFTGIPSWVKRVTVMFNGVSTSGTNQVQIQIGNATFSTTGYNSFASYGGGASQYTASAITTGFVLEPTGATGATALRYGSIVLTLIGSNTWAVHGGTGGFAGVVSAVGGISPALGGALDRVRITTIGGTDTFDAGAINLLWE